jgi:hypothetical protein
MGHIAWGVSSVFASLVSHRSSAFFRVIALETRLTAVLLSGYLISYHSVLIFFLYINSRSRSGRSLLNSTKVILLVDSL